MGKRRSVTVIVPAYNAQATIGPCLDAIRAALQPGDELIVYDDGATDDTNAMAKAAGARILRNEGRPKGPGYGRNAAAKAATADLLLFVDADVVIAPDVLDLLAQEISETGAIAAFGSYDDHPRSDRYTSLYANLRHHFVHQNGPSEATTFWSGIGMIDRQTFLKFGGYDTDLFSHPSIEDVELGVRLKSKGYRIRLVHGAFGTHCKDWSLWRVWHTDVVRRAYPWSELIADGRTQGLDLNVATGERITAFMAVASLLCLLAVPFFGSAAGIAMLCFCLAYGFRNRKFFGFLAKRLPFPGLAVAVAMHWCYHIYATATFVLVQVTTKLHLRTPSSYMASIAA
ncbi:MAG: glycosyltransferase [Sphingomonadaceae bacterium]